MDKKIQIMKKLILILAIISFIGCSNDDTSTVKCSKVVSKGWNVYDGNYIKLEDGRKIITTNYQLGDSYCE